MIYSKIVKNINFPLYSVLSGKLYYYQQYKKIERNQWLPVKSLERLRWRLFSKLIKHAFENTEYYRKVIKELGCVPEDFVGIDSFHKLPIITKKDLQDKGDILKAKNLIPGSFVEDASGGSTGEPTIFYVTNYRYILRNWEQTRHDRWSGWDIGERMAVLWGASHDLKFKEKLYGQLKNMLLYRQIPLDAFSLTNDVMKKFGNTIVKKQPTMLLAYANAAYTFAQFLEDINFQTEKFRLKGIVSSAEKLYKFQRKFIEKIFGCPVYDRLGSREVGLIASECEEHNGLHMNADSLIIEFLDDFGNPVSEGQPGRIVITDLHNYAMPFIRYDTGDIGSWTNRQCRCGRTLPLMECIEGRSSDFILTKDGRKIHGEYFTHLVYGLRGMKQFQFVQKNIDFIELKIIKDFEWKQNQEFKILEQIRRYMKDKKLQINLEFVDSIPTPRSGKRRFTISELTK